MADGETAMAHGDPAMGGTAMQAVDGNALAGQLFEVFGAEMTTVSGTCTSCGATAPIAELRVYLRAPGSVARCRVCGAVLMVLVEIHGTTRLHMGGFELIDPPDAGRDPG